MSFFILPFAFCLSSAADFRPPISVTADQPGVLAYMSRSSAGQLAWTPQGTLALVYWTGGEDTSLDQPNRVYFREWTPKTDWAAPAVQIDHSVRPDGTEIGARHPALLVRPDKSLFVVWHDSRNCTTALSLIDNIEIYGAARPAGGAFGADVRLTQTSSGSNGDNGYLPKLAALPGGRMALAWYDFTWNANKSDVVVKISDAAGSFGSPALSDFLRTDDSFRETADAAASFTVPSIAADGNGILHVVWATGDNSTPEEASLYYGRIDPVAKTWLEHRKLATLAGGAADPAKLIADKTGDVWLVYTDGSAVGNENLVLRRHGKNAADFDALIQLAAESGDQHAGDLAVDSEGKIHCVYLDRGAGVRYRTYDPATQTNSDAVSLNGTLTGTWIEPAIALDPADHVFAVWGRQQYAPFRSELIYTTNHPGATGTRCWGLYE